MSAPQTVSRLRATAMIAPCGINCRVCYAHLRTVNRCTGCRGEDCGKGVSILRCSIRTCKVRAGKFCDDRCEQFPCDRLRRLDKRYRTKYGMSLLENLEKLAASGLRKFLKSERERWICHECGGGLCVHYRSCQSCGSEWH